MHTIKIKVWTTQQRKCTTDVSISPLYVCVLSAFDVSLLMEPWRQCNFHFSREMYQDFQHYQVGSAKIL